MGKPLRAMGLRQYRCPSLCLIAVFIITGWCRAAQESSAEADTDPVARKDPRSQDPGSQDRDVHRFHPKAPPSPRDEEIPLNARKFDLHFEQGIWPVIVEDNGPDAKVTLGHVVP